MPANTSNAMNARARYEALQRSLVSRMALGQFRLRLDQPADPSMLRSHLAAELADKCQIRLSSEARKMLAPTMTNAEFVETLIANDLDLDARRVLAFALPRRRALWWGCLTAWDALGQLATGDSARLLSAIASYVIQPIDDHLRNVATAGKPIKRASLLGCLLYGTFVAHGSVVGPDKPRVPAPPHVFGRLLESAVYLSSVTKDVRNYRLHLREYLQLGQQLGTGPAPWLNVGKEGATSE